MTDADALHRDAIVIDAVSPLLAEAMRPKGGKPKVPFGSGGKSIVCRARSTVRVCSTEGAGSVRVRAAVLPQRLF